MTRFDKQHEGKEDLYLDIDRMINEGMAGGSIADETDLKQIGPTTDITGQEEPPIKQGE